MLTCGNDLLWDKWTKTVGMAGRYSNRPDLLQQLRKVAAVLSDGDRDNGTGAEVASERVVAHDGCVTASPWMIFKP